jgi:hypothetical protein
MKRSLLPMGVDPAWVNFKMPKAHLPSGSTAVLKIFSRFHVQRSVFWSRPEIGWYFGTEKPT